MTRWIVYVTQDGEKRPASTANSREEAEEMAARIRRIAERLWEPGVTVAIRQERSV